MGDSRLPDLSEMREMLHKIPIDTRARAKLFCEKHGIPDAEAMEIAEAAKEMDATVIKARLLCEEAIEKQEVSSHTRAIVGVDDIHAYKDKFMTLIAKAESAHPLEH